MNKLHAWIAGAVVLTLGLLAAGWFLLIAPKRSEVATLKASTETQNSANVSLRADIAQLKLDSASLPQRQADLAVIKQQLPETPDLPTFVRAVRAFAVGTDENEPPVVINSITPSPPTAVSAGDAAAGGAATASTGLMQIPVAMDVTGTYAEITSFLQQLQGEMKRVYLIENLAFTPETEEGGDKTKPKIKLVITGKIFTLATATDSATAAPAAAGANS